MLHQDRHPNRQRSLIVNADDFGLTEAINAGIERAFLRGIVTSASLMVRAPAARSAARRAGNLPGLGVGLHLDLGEWVFREGAWIARYERVDLDDEADVTSEVERQIAAFHDLTGCSPTHLDSHQHVHSSEPVRGVVLAAGRRLGVPVRGAEPEIRHCGDFYGQTGRGGPLPERISVEALVRILDRLEAGWTELGCHPGAAGPCDSVYANERVEELRTLEAPRVQHHLQSRSIRLASVRDFRDRSRAIGSPVRASA